MILNNNVNFTTAMGITLEFYKKMEKVKQCKNEDLIHCVNEFKSTHILTLRLTRISAIRK